MSRTDQDSTPTIGRRAVRGARLGVALVAVAAVAVGIAWWVSRSDEDREPIRATDPVARRELLAAWARSQRATYTLEGSFRRSTDSGERVDDPLVVVQRPPDRIVLGYGSWDGVVDGRGIHCVRDGRSGSFHDCTVGERVDAAAADRAAIDDLTTLTAGRTPSYRVARAGVGCFDLRLAPGRLPTSHGLRARYCFDRVTGALARTRVVHAGAVDVTSPRRILPSVDPSDLPHAG